MNGGKGWGVQEHHLLRFFVQSSKFEAGGHSVGMQVGGGGGRLKHSPNHLSLTSTSHSGEKTNKCNQCDQALYRANHLMKHMKRSTHSSISSEPQFRIKSLPQKFQFLMGLLRLILSLTGYDPLLQRDTPSDNQI